MLKYVFPILSVMLMSCASEVTFQDDPMCPSCIERACHSQNTDETFKTHFSTLSSEDQAQIIAMMEADETCFQNQSWISGFADSAYESYAASFFDTAQPLYKSRALRAFDNVLQDRPARAQSLNYLKKHAASFRDEAWAAEKLEALSELRESDDVFPLLVMTASREQLEELAGLESTPARDNALIYRWKDLSEESQNRALSAWVSAAWSMQTSGSAQLPQYLVLDWKKRPFPDGVPEFTATMDVDSIKVQNSEVKRGDWKAVDEFRWPPLDKPDAKHARIDLQPWLTTTGSYRISASATMKIWPHDVDKACLEGAESCEQTPIIEQPVTLDRSYKVFVGLITGAPHSIKDNKENKPTSDAVGIELCNASTCTALWQNGSVIKKKEALDVTQGEDFYLKILPGNADKPIASRLMARAAAGKTWREIASVSGIAPQNYTIPLRGEAALGELCAQIGPCRLELEMRPSLRMARRDPRISRYWGATLQLGTITLNIQNLTPEQMGVSN